MDDQNKKSKSLLYMVVAIVVIIVLILLASIKNKKEAPENPPLTQTDIELNNAVSSDSTAQIQENINKIDVSDTTDQDLQDIDNELKNL
jgi:hypothetical protein